MPVRSHDSFLPENPVFMRWAGQGSNLRPKDYESRQGLCCVCKTWNGGLPCTCGSHGEPWFMGWIVGCRRHEVYGRSSALEMT